MRHDVPGIGSAGITLISLAEETLFMTSIFVANASSARLMTPRTILLIIGLLFLLIYHDRRNFCGGTGGASYGLALGPEYTY
jgi:hypothetical protein